jgi:hypothetical protein
LADFLCDTYQVLVQKTSKVSSYKVNSCLGENTYLSLKKKEWIILKTSQGKKRRVNGPYSDRLSLKKKLTSMALIKNIIERIKKVLRLRGETKNNCGIWEIDVLQDQFFCVDTSLKRPVLCRTDTSAIDTVIIQDTLQDKQKRKQLQYQWPPGELYRLKGWAEDYLPISDGAVYWIQVGNRERRTLTFYQAPESLTDSYKMAWMLDKQCYRQADMAWSEQSTK